MAALASAASAFDPSFGVPFERFAARRVKGALLDELRGADWATRSVRSRVRTRDGVCEALSARLGRAPSTRELATAMNVDVATLESLEADLHRSVVLSVDRLAESRAVDALLPVAAETPESVLVERERRNYLAAAVEVLPERLNQVVVGYFLEERPMKELAEEFGVTESRVSQLRAEALRLLKDALNSQLAPELVPEPAVGVAARRRTAYYALVAAQSTYRSRLSAPAPRTAMAGLPQTA